MKDEFTRAESAAKFLESQSGLFPRIGVVLGSGLGGFADELSDAARIPYENIPFFPRSTAIGHAGQMVIGNVGDVPVAAMQGRVHLYEGYSAQEVAFPIRVFGLMGIHAVVLTNAAGRNQSGIQARRARVIKDHLNLQGQNPLVGENDDALGRALPI